jgi:hypothetical protein
VDNDRLEIPPRNDSIRAAATLVSSPRVRSFVGTVAALVVLPAAGWVGAKLDTKLEVDALVRQNGEFQGRISALESQRKDMQSHIDALSAPVTEGVSPGGPITQLQAQMRVAHRNALLAYAVGLAFDKDKARKRAEAERFVTAYNNQLRRGITPDVAAETTIDSIALP